MTSEKRALLVELERVDSYAYGDWSGETRCLECEIDLDSIESILSATPLKTEEETEKPLFV
jgi:hypothetical protein